MVKRFLCVLALALLLPAIGLGQSTPAKEQKVRKMLQLSGAADLGQQVMDGMIAQFSQMPNLPKGFLDKFKQLAKPSKLIDMIVPIYAKHLDDDAIDAAIAFFQSPGGQKFVKAQPGITKESMEIGAKWGREIAEEAMRQMKNEK